MTPEAAHHDCDVLIAGSGAGGLAAAVAARELGLEVLVVEKACTIGGTTAWSGGELWVPANRWQKTAGVMDTTEAAAAYLDEAAGGRGPAELRATFTRHAARAVEKLVELGAMAVEPMFDAPDYEMQLAGACPGGRTLRTVPFDGRKLGAEFVRLRDPLAAGQILGGLSMAREDLPHFRGLLRSPRSAAHVARLVTTHGWQRLGGLHRGARTTMGNALIARLVAWLMARNVPIWTAAALRTLETLGTTVSGGVVETLKGTVRVRARHGVILATGGFSHDQDMMVRHYPHVADGQSHLPLPPPEVKGDGLRLAQALGGALGGQVIQPSAWTVVSRYPVPSGATFLVPHFGDRSKPGIIAVLANGSRFANEAADYHVFCAHLIKACAGEREAQAWLIADDSALRSYGLGRVGAFPFPLGPALRSGYLIRGRSSSELALAAGISPQGLERSLERWNQMAGSGRDTDYGKGENYFDRSSGDASHHPNPCVAPITRPPFYAIRIQPGNLSTFLGLATDSSSRVLDHTGRPLPGLYAVGADAESIAGGAYPAAGITLGPAVTFGVLAVEKIAGKTLSTNIAPSGAVRRAPDAATLINPA
jgi:succinate dehydrogenase/fumarate reductase flavoprotein subunit